MPVGCAAGEQIGARDRELDGLLVVAAGALAVLAEEGRRVPADVAVGGFDDSGLAATLTPPLTTMRQPFERIAHEMVRPLLEVVGGEDPAAVTIPTTLVERSST